MKTTSSRNYSENYYALVVAIIKDVTTERAFILMQGGDAGKKSRGFTEEEIQEMIRRRERGETYKSIGSLFDTSDYNVNATIRRYNSRQEKKKASG